MGTLLTVSETFSAFWDSVGGFLAQYWGQLTASISIPMVIAFIVKYIMYKVKNNKTIHNAITKATGAVASSTDVLGSKIDSFEAKTTQMMVDFEAKMEEKIDQKFADLKSKRIEAYNSIMEGKVIVDEKLEEVKDVAEAVNGLAKEVKTQYEALPDEAPKIEDLIGGNTPNSNETTEPEQVVKESKNTSKISENQLLI